MKKEEESFRQLERLTRGFANHRRIEILDLLAKEPELSVAQVAASLKVDFRTISEHIRRLAIAGLVLKRNQGASVQHKLSDRGVVILKFLRTLE